MCACVCVCICIGAFALDAAMYVRTVHKKQQWVSSQGSRGIRMALRRVAAAAAAGNMDMDPWGSCGGHRSRGVGTYARLPCSLVGMGLLVVHVLVHTEVSVVVQAGRERGGHNGKRAGAARTQGDMVSMD